MRIETENLQLELAPGQALRLKDLAVRKGEKVLIEGPSGCGKTSLLHVLGLLKPALHGQVRYEGEVILNKLDQFRRNQFGFIFQRLSLIEHLTVGENILLDQVTQIEASILERLGIKNHLKNRTALLSLGEQQRVAVARALHKKPAILFADEPTSSLDRPLAETVGREIANLESTVLAVSHDERILKYFDRVISWSEILK